MRLNSMMIACGIAACVYPIASVWIKKLRYEGEPLSKECPLITMRHKWFYSVLYVTIALCFPFEKIFCEHSTAYRVWSIGGYFSLMWHYFIMRARLNDHVRENREATPEGVFRWGGGWLGSFENNGIFCIFVLLFYAWEKKLIQHGKGTFLSFLFRNCFFAYCRCFLWIGILAVVLKDMCI